MSEPSTRPLGPLSVTVGLTVAVVRNPGPYRAGVTELIRNLVLKRTENPVDEVTGEPGATWSGAMVKVFDLAPVYREGTNSLREYWPGWTSVKLLKTATPFWTRALVVLPV